MWLEGCQGFNNTWLVFTHINCVVTYSKLGNPALKTNHIYLDVNYDEDDSTCTLTSPTDIEAYHSRDSNAINFWNGDREVYDICRSGKGLILSGDEYEGDEEHSSTPCERITCIRDMGRDGNLVDISGLGTLYDGTYRIKSFGWNKISEQPEYYTWQLELEVED
jgi:hypothetical protein